MPNRMKRVVKRTKRRGQAHKTLALAFVCSPANNLGRQGNLAALVTEIDHGAATRLQTLAGTYEYLPNGGRSGLRLYVETLAQQKTSAAPPVPRFATKSLAGMTRVLLATKTSPGSR